MQLRLASVASALLSVVLLGGCSPADSTDAQASAEYAIDAPTVTRGNIRFIEGFERGQEEATRTGKPMMLFFTASWCTYCHQMAAEAFTLPQAVDLSERFTCVLIDADAESGVCQRFQVRGFPTMQFGSPGGVPLNRLGGKQPGQQLVMEMHAALQAVARRAGHAIESVRR